MADDVFASFLVALGFKVDTASQSTAKKSVADYQRAVEQAEKAIEDARWAGAKTEEEIAKLTRETNLRLAREALQRAKDEEKAEADKAQKRKQRAKEFADGLAAMATAATAAAAAVGYAVGKVTGIFDNLYFQAQRSGTSVQSLRALGYAFSQTGGTAQQAAAAVDHFTTALRDNPGLRKFVQDLGVDDKLQGVDKLLATVDALNKREPYVTARQHAELLGISEGDYNLLTRQAEAIKRYRAEYDEITKRIGVNGDDAAKASTTFQRTLGTLQATAGALADKLLIQLAPALEQVTQGFLDWIKSHPEQVDHIVKRISDGIVWLSQKITQLVEWFAGSDGEAFVKRWDDFSDRIAAIGHAFEVVWGVLKKIDEWLHLSALYGFIDKLGTLILSGRFGLGGVVQDALGIGGGGGGGGAPADNRRWYEKILPKALGGKDAPGGPIPGGTTPIGREARNQNAQTIIGELRRAGYNNNAIAAVVGSMQTESSFNPRAHNNITGGHTGLWQWDSTRWPKIKRWIESQGGDPYDAAWQTKAWVGEHNAKPGDPLYDTGRTQRGGAILRNTPSIDDAIHGVRESERFGVGEEGGRAAKARGWLPHVAASGDQKPDPATPAPPPAAGIRGLPNMTPGGFDPNRINPQSAMQPAPAAASPVTNNTSTSNKAVTQHITNNTTVNEAKSPRESGRVMESALARVHDLALSNAQTAVI